MKKHIHISGFADEICGDFNQQLETVVGLGMEYISLRSANGKSIAEFTVEEVKKELLPKLNQFGVKVSSLGSPIGKVGAEDEDGYQKQLKQLDRLCEICKVLDCKYIRVFSCYIPAGKNPDDYKEIVISKMKGFLETAKRHGIILIHENEKDIYGDTGIRCKILMEALSDPCFLSAFDFANFVQCKEDTLVCWELLKDYVAYIHIKDAVASNKENVVCGTGEGHIREILEQAIEKEGYEGFLTLEPHLVLFEALADLELDDAKQIIKEDKAKNGADGYAMQYHGLCQILKSIVPHINVTGGE